MSLTSSGDGRRSPIIGDLRQPGEGDVERGIVAFSGDDRTDVLIEVDVRFPGGLAGAVRRVMTLWQQGVSDDRLPIPVSNRLLQVVVTRNELHRLVEADRDGADGIRPAIFRAWPDYVLEAQIDRSAVTVKADAAWRSYQAAGKGIVWAVIDSGIQADHAHFSALEIGALARGTVAAGSVTSELHWDFTHLVQPSKFGGAASGSGPLIDELGHGSHVAGIISGQCPDDPVTAKRKLVAASDEPAGGAGFVQRMRTGLMSGMAPLCELVSLKVLRSDGDSWVTSSAAVIAALEYIRTQVNVSRSMLRIHGVNLSLGCEWDPAHYAAGQSPLCQTVNELVASGVVVVISSGNGGNMQAIDNARQRVSLGGTITEPGHSADCITVGSTHRDSPMTFGISWTSGKGPTLDGRMKPDVVAPGEWISSVAVGRLATRAGLAQTDIDGRCTYAEQSGTSMAAPHVSGVIAGFLANRPEYIGRPFDVKRMICESATDLHREAYAQGHGVIDAMRLLANS